MLVATMHSQLLQYLETSGDLAIYMYLFVTACYLFELLHSAEARMIFFSEFAEDSVNLLSL